jgi:hypothetical protein
MGAGQVLTAVKAALRLAALGLDCGSGLPGNFKPAGRRRKDKAAYQFVVLSVRKMGRVSPFWWVKDLRGRAGVRRILQNKIALVHSLSLSLSRFIYPRIQVDLSQPCSEHSSHELGRISSSHSPRFPSREENQYSKNPYQCCPNTPTGLEE